MSFNQLNKGNPLDFDFEQTKYDVMDNLEIDIHKLIKEYEVAGLSIEEIRDIIIEELR